MPITIDLSAQTLADSQSLTINADAIDFGAGPTAIFEGYENGAEGSDITSDNTVFSSNSTVIAKALMTEFMVVTLTVMRLFQH